MPETVTYCAEHGDTPTSLRCSRCDKLVCPRCMVQAPVGIRCREHGQGQKLPTYQVSRTYLARAIGAALGLGVIGGVAIVLLYPLLGFYASIALAGFGYVAGEGISRGANRKRGTPLVVAAVIAVLIAFTMVVLGGGYFGYFLDLFDLLGLAAAIYLAIGRVR